MDAVGSFLMDQLLKMQWLSDLIAIFIDALGLDASSRWGGTLHFFIYDTIKIVILLLGVSKVLVATWWGRCSER